jgi:hypothetical protein
MNGLGGNCAAHVYILLPFSGKPGRETRATMLREELDTGIPTEPTRRTDAIILTRCRDDAMPLWAATASGIEKVGTNASEEDAADRAGQEREKWTSGRSDRGLESHTIRYSSHSEMKIRSN